MFCKCFILHVTTVLPQNAPKCFIGGLQSDLQGSLQNSPDLLAVLSILFSLHIMLITVGWCSAGLTGSTLW